MSTVIVDTSNKWFQWNLAANKNKRTEQPTLDIETTVSPAPTGTKKFWVDMYEVDEKDELVCLGVTYDGETAFVFKNDKYLEMAREGLEKEEWLMHNGYFDTLFMQTLGWDLTLKHDTMAMAYLLDSDQPKSLEYLSKEILGLGEYKGIDWEQILETPFVEVAEMNGEDVRRTHALYRPLADRLNQNAQLSRLYQWILIPAIKELVKVTGTGIPIYSEAVADLDSHLEEFSSETLAALISSVPEPEIPWGKPSYWRKANGPGPYPFNPRSTKQVAHLLYDLFSLEPAVFTDTGNPSTSNEALALLPQEGSHAKTVELIRAYRKATKAKSSFTEAWPKLTGEDGRLHPKYKPLHTMTGRLSSEAPNIQQVPHTTEFRSLFAAPEGYTWMKADYSQIELRLAAWMADEQVMLEAFRKGEDLHGHTAAAILGSREHRQGGKTLNFGLLYGAYPKTLLRVASMDYGIQFTLQEATVYREEFFDLYPQLGDWHTKSERLITSTGLSVSPLGRVRHLPNARIPQNDQTWAVVGKAVREGLNHPVQSMASDLLMVSLVRLGPLMRAEGVEIVATVHDEIDLLVPNDKVSQVAATVKKTMEDTEWLGRFGISLSVPVLADIETGPSWGELENYV